MRVLVVVAMGFLAGCTHVRDLESTEAWGCTTSPLIKGPATSIGLHIRSLVGAVHPEGGHDLLLARIVYPEIAWRAGIEGGVYAETFVGANGVAQRARVTKSDSEHLEDALLNAVKTTRMSFVLALGEGDSARVELSAHFRILHRSPIETCRIRSSTALAYR